MGEVFYVKLNKFMLNHKNFSKTVLLFNKTVTLLIYVFYPALLIFLFKIKFNNILQMVLVPLISLIILSVMRKAINFPRPFERFNITPLCRCKKGCSMPSRHTFCIVIIALSSFLVNTVLGSIIVFLGVILAVCRVLLGVHTIRDVTVAILSAVLSFIIGTLI